MCDSKYVSTLLTAQEHLLTWHVTHTCPAIVFSMCRMVIAAIEEGSAQVIADVKRLARYEGDSVLPKTPQALCNQIFHTIYIWA